MLHCFARYSSGKTATFHAICRDIPERAEDIQEKLKIPVLHVADATSKKD
jgi:aspartate/glutamate racemase